MQVKTPFVELHINGKNVTRDLSPFLIEVSYSDNLTVSDTVEVRLDNKDWRFVENWFIKPSEELELKIGYLGGETLTCGTFKITEVEFTGPPSLVVWHGQSSPQSGGDLFKVKRSRVWENTTLTKVVEQIANENGLQPFIEVKEDPPLKRIEQNNISDYQFLQNLAKKYGYNLKWFKEKLVWVEWAQLWQAEAITTLKPTNLIRWRIKDRPREVYKEAEIEYYDPKEKKTKTYRCKDPNIEWGSIYRSKERIDNLTEAKKRCETILRVKNNAQIKPILTLEGNPNLVAGANIQLEGFGIYDGKYSIAKATHKVCREGYLTILELQRVPT